MRPERGGADYQLVWSRWLFQQEAAELLNSKARLKSVDWDERCELLLEDAFAGEAPRDDFLATVGSDSYGASDQRKSFLVGLLRRAPHLNTVAAGRVAYWSDRHHNTQPGTVSLAGTVREYLRVVSHLDWRGYFEKAFGKDCVDSPSQDTSDLLERDLGVSDLWPLSAERLTADQDLFCDIIEVLHDRAARPRARSLHPYAGCGYHHSAFSLETGRAVYRWRVNQVLDRSDLGLRLASEGDDEGRLIAVTDLARSDLASSMARRSDQDTGDVVRHAIALFRAQAAVNMRKDLQQSLSLESLKNAGRS